MSQLWKGAIYGQPITKKNSQKIITNRSTGRPMIMPSQQYRDYEKASARQIVPPDSPIEGPVNVKCIYYKQNARKCDLTNLLEATHDILVKNKVLADDNSDVICSLDGSRVYIDRDDPRVEITIEEAAVCNTEKS